MAEKIDAIVMHLMSVLDPDLNIGITARATPEAIELLKGSDSPFAGYVISCLVDDVESRHHYEDWDRRTLNRTLDKENGGDCSPP